jgi:hypothetical protein
VARRDHEVASGQAGIGRDEIEQNTVSQLAFGDSANRVIISGRLLLGSWCSV